MTYSNDGDLSVAIHQRDLLASVMRKLIACEGGYFEVGQWNILVDPEHSDDMGPGITLDLECRLTAEEARLVEWLRAEVERR